MKKKEVLFVQGAGEGAYAEDAELVKSLKQALGEAYRVHYPPMPNDGDAEYATLRAALSKALAATSGKVIVVGHSIGGWLLLKYLSEEVVDSHITGIFTVAAPYFGAGGWDDEEAALRDGFASRLPQRAPLFLYHSRDDEVVPFAHLTLYKRALTHATVREFDGRGHQFKNDLTEVAADIKQI